MSSDSDHGKRCGIGQGSTFLWTEHYADRTPERPAGRDGA